MIQENRDRYNLKQLNLEVPQEVLTEIKIIAAKRNIPMRTWLLRQIIKALKSESRD